MKWTDPKRQQFLANQSAAGLSATEIANQLGESKDAVASAMYRYGLFARQGPGRHAGGGNRRKWRRGKVSLARVNALGL